MEEFKNFIKRMGLRLENMFVPEIRGKSRNVHASLCPLGLSVSSPHPVRVGAFCVLSVPGPVVPYMLFHISPCPLGASVAFPLCPQCRL